MVLEDAAAREAEAPERFGPFGYQPEHTMFVEGVQVAEGNDPDTLTPRVVMRLRLPGGERLAFSLSLEMAEGLADELIGGSRRAAEKHWDPR